MSAAVGGWKMNVIDLRARRLTRAERHQCLTKAARLRTSAAKLVKMADEMKLKASDLERSAANA
jgi:hypothetical protein